MYSSSLLLISFSFCLFMCSSLLLLTSSLALHRSTIEFLKRRRGEEQEHEHGLHRDVSSFTWSISLDMFLSPVVLCPSRLISYDLLLDSKITQKKPNRHCKNTCRSPRHDSTDEHETHTKRALCIPKWCRSKVCRPQLSACQPYTHNTFNRAS